MNESIDEACTVGNWPTERESAAALDIVLHNIGLWNVYHEVPGALTQPRPGQADRSMRIDRVLVPNDKLISLGWTQGIIGIEIKKSGVKIGPPIAQAMDYSRTVWTLQPGNFRVWLDWVFIWPMHRQAGNVASILAQNRIGSAFMDRYRLLHLKSGEQNVLRISSNGHIDIGAAANGRKVGSR